MSGHTAFPWTFHETTIKVDPCAGMVDRGCKIILLGSKAAANRKLLEALPHMVEVLENVASVPIPFAGWREKIAEQARDALISAGLMKHKSELKPCPFCSCDSMDVDVVTDRDRPAVQCRCCGIYGPDGGNVADAIERWNRRHS